MRLSWDQPTQTRYEIGVDQGVFYPQNGVGEVWNGLTAVKESPTDMNERVRYIDGIRTRTGRRPGDFSGIIEAYSYPEALYDHVLSQRKQRGFGLCYRTRTESAYKLHLVYNVLLGPSSHVYNEDVVPYSWDFTTTPEAIPYAIPTSHLVIEAAVAYSDALSEIESVLYGSDTGEARLPSAAEVIAIFEQNAILQIIDNGDGTWTAIGPETMIQMLDSTTFQITSPSAVYISTDTYQISSY